VNLSIKENIPQELIFKLESFVFSQVKKEMASDEGRSIFINNFGTFGIKPYTIPHIINNVRHSFDAGTMTKYKFKRMLRKTHLTCNMNLK